jgi:hypothetical protein
MQELHIEDLAIAITRKNIKNLHLKVYPPDGEVKVSAPYHLDERELRIFVASKLSWIRQQQEKFKGQEPPSIPQYRSGELHWFRGQEYPLAIVSATPCFPAGHVRLHNQALEVYIKLGSPTAQCQQFLRAWYREQLKLAIAPLIKLWEPRLGVQVWEWRIKRMKTKWGTCNISAHRLWFNLELAKVSDRALEYVVVHEMTHLLERLHNARFHTLMDHFLPDWQSRREELNQFPLGI